MTATVPTIKVPRTSTVLATVKDMWAIHQRDIRLVAVGVAQNDDLARLARHCDPAAPPRSRDRATLTDVTTKALDRAGANNRAHHGTASHAVIEQLADGFRADYLDPAEQRLAAQVTDLLDAAGLVIIDRERPIYNAELRCGGQFDLIVRSTRTGASYIADLKTGAGLYVGETSMQIATYAHATGRWHGPSDRWTINSRRQYELPATDQPGWEPMPDDLEQDVGMVIHAPHDSDQLPSLNLVDLTTGWEWARLARQVYDARKQMKQAAPVSTFTENGQTS